ncbi:MAG: RagB/SusD family nutrient uptake outer membrane protein [Tannerellaceae bacterium]|jgi:hypothetical protein|nr:RagB/SusD family nutrient uptake outer membrane protein [Tannerellaceae bacterium]
MKKNILFLLPLAFAACNDLDLEPVDSITTARFFRSTADAQASVNAIYSALTYEENSEQSLYGRNLNFLTDMPTDYHAAGASAINANVRALSAAAYDATNDRVALAWKQIYRGINRANIAIDNIPNVSGEEHLKLRLIREAKFLRALLYFNAVRLWGNVPLVLHEAPSLETSILKAGRTPIDPVYHQIIEDLSDAENLPLSYSGSDIGRASAFAAKALLAKVYLTQKNYPAAADKAAAVIASNSFDLFPHFADAFKPATKNGIEHIFSAQFEDGQSGTIGNTGNTLPGAALGQALANIQPADIISDISFYNNYDDNDTRKYATFITSITNPASGEDFTYLIPRFAKYIDFETFAAGKSQSAAPVNYPIIRYADVLLIHAEALNEQYGFPTQEAFRSINRVRRRAFGHPFDQPSPADLPEDLDHNAFLRAIQHERLLEFVQEGHRWFDLVRWGILEETVKPVKPAFSVRNYLFPIPQTQHDLNIQGLPQNPGY